MASVKEMQTKGGKVFYKISVSRGYGKAPFTMRWYAPEGYSRRTLERELRKAVAEFERACAAGEVETRQDRKAREKREAEEALQECKQESKIL